LPPLARARAGARRAVAPDERRPGRRGDPGAPAGARRPRGGSGPRAWTDLPAWREGARLLAGPAADRAAVAPGRGRLRLRPAPRTRGDRPLLRDAVDAGRDRTLPGDHHPDRGSAVRAARPGVVPRSRGRLRRSRQPPRPGPPGLGHLSRDRRAAAAPLRAGATAPVRADARRPLALADRQRRRDASP